MITGRMGRLTKDHAEVVEEDEDRGNYNEQEGEEQDRFSWTTGPVDRAISLGVQRLCGSRHSAWTM
eukprot:7684166-Pyramimonas_sp.AAC.1